ncbi:MAG: queuosine precursor transporter [bacterium]
MFESKAYTSTDGLIVQTRYLWFIMLSYTMVIVLANWFDSRLVHVFCSDTDAGTLIFPLTFLLSDLITEVYGYKHARQAIWCGFLFNFVFIAYGQLVIHLPSPSYHTNNASFDALLATNMRIIVASAISYLCSEPLNSLIMAKLKIKTKGRYMGVRFVLSTIIASAVDSVIFGTLAFYNVMSNINLFNLIVTMWLVKSFVEIICLPLSINLTKRLKKSEQLDIYDKNTVFNVFSLNTNYTDIDNEFGKI